MVANYGCERSFVGLREDKLELPLSFLEWVLQIVAAQHCSRESIHRLGFAQCLGECCDEQCHGCQTLLPINHEQRFPGGYSGVSLIDVNYRTDKMHRDVVVSTGAHN